MFYKIYFIKEKFLRILGYNESVISTLLHEAMITLEIDPYAVIFSIDIVVSVKKSKQISLFKQQSLMIIRRQKAVGLANW